MTFIEQWLTSLEFVYLVCQVSSSEPVSEVWQILHSLLATLVKWEIYVNKFKFKSLPLILLFLSASCVRWGCKINENYLAASCPLIRGNIIHTLFGDMGHLSRRRISLLFSRHDLCFCKWDLCYQGSFLSVSSFVENFMHHELSIYHLFFVFPRTGQGEHFSLWHYVWICSAPKYLYLV